jgi:hypothetical protein
MDGGSMCRRGAMKSVVFASGLPTGEPVSNHVPSGPRTTSPARASSANAVEIVGRRALTQHPMRERQRDRDAVRGHPAPALGQVPQQCEHAPVDPIELGDRLQHREATAAPAAALQQRAIDLRIPREPDRGVLVEHRESRPRERAPAHHCLEQLRIRRLVPRPHQIARTQQLHARHVVREQFSPEQPIGDKEPEPAAIAPDGRLETARAGLDAEHTHLELAPRRIELRRQQSAAEIRIKVEQRLDRLPG